MKGRCSEEDLVLDLTRHPVDDKSAIVREGGEDPGVCRGPLAAVGALLVVLVPHHHAVLAARSVVALYGGVVAFYDGVVALCGSVVVWWRCMVMWWRCMVIWWRCMVMWW